MKRIFVLTIAILSSAGAEAFVAAGQAHTCAWDGRHGSPAACWGLSSHGEDDSPPLRHVRALGAGAWHNCALHDDAGGAPLVNCWGDKSFGQGKDPALPGRPLSLSVGRWHNCALVASDAGTRVHCWGKDDLGQASPPSLKAPTAVFAGADLSCALHDGGKLRCWGRTVRDYPATSVANPGGSELACAPEGGQDVRCWTNAPGGDRPRIARIGRNLQCRIEDQRLHCQTATGEQAKAPTARGRPRDFAVGDWHVCALFESGVACEGTDDREGQQRVPTGKLHFGPTFRGWEGALAFLEDLADMVYKFDADFLTALKPLLGGTSSDRSAFVLNALRPFFVGLGYRKTADTYVLPSVEQLDRLTAEGGVAPSGSGAEVLRRLGARLGAPAAPTAVRMLAHSLNTAKTLLDEPDRVAAERAVAALGSALSSDPPRVSAAVLTEVDRLCGRMSAVSYLGGRGDLCRTLVVFLQ